MQAAKSQPELGRLSTPLLTAKTRSWKSCKKNSINGPVTMTNEVKEERKLKEGRMLMSLNCSIH
jgi:hypothetical protein